MHYHGGWQLGTDLGGAPICMSGSRMRGEHVRYEHLPNLISTTYMQTNPS